MDRSGIFAEKRRVPLLPRHFAAALILFTALLLVVLAASVALGSRTVSGSVTWAQNWQETLDGVFHPDVNSYGANVVRKRLARTFFALLSGAALGVSGALMQAVTRNPIADPSILGVNTGASLFVVCGIAFFNITSRLQYIGFALVGAMLTAVLVYSIGSLGRGGATPVKLVLAGSAVSAAFSSLVNAVLLPRSSVVDTFRFWQVGSVGSGTWESTLAFLPFALAGVAIALLSSPALNALALGDEAAAGLGVRTGLLRLVASFASVLLCGASTAMAGPIGFIGLLAPHVMRLLLGADLRVTIPMSALAGAVFLTAADVIGRLVAYPGELQVGIVTAFIGAPVLIYSAIRAKV